VHFGTRCFEFLKLCQGKTQHLAYLADIFEALNQLNKKLQRPAINIIVHTDAINAFVVKLNLWRQRSKNNHFASFHRLTENWK